VTKIMSFISGAQTKGVKRWWEVRLSRLRFYNYLWVQK